MRRPKQKGLSPRLQSGQGEGTSWCSVKTWAWPTGEIKEYASQPGSWHAEEAKWVTQGAPNSHLGPSLPLIQCRAAVLCGAVKLQLCDQGWKSLGEMRERYLEGFHHFISGGRTRHCLSSPRASAPGPGSPPQNYTPVQQSWMHRQ
ncbi:hypothetical protein AAFF_G00310870 [Aldrovandia affinis]|uniref:Uncharacterized protein n=1 Tax=Aldrovandia affinis TaxID=143900 RepID=A0AAD7W153_9TELE|nr:hypothetical protein AAFF_G00310870 [Aldrovandia affinis]